MTGPEPTWIVVATSSGVTEAAMIAERLRSLDIPAAVQYEPGAPAMGITVGPFGQARVLVPESFFEQATIALEPPDFGDESLLLLDDDDDYDSDDE